MAVEIQEWVNYIGVLVFFSIFKLVTNVLFILRKNIQKKI